MPEKKAGRSAAQLDIDRVLEELDVDRAAAKLYRGGPRPYGLRVNELGEWERVPEEIAIIEEMRDLRRRRGATYTAIADHLNARGVPTPKGGARWTGSSVWRILRNPLYRLREPAAIDPGDWSALRAAEVARVTGFLADDPPE